MIASNETAGRYYCKAHSIGFQEISAEAQLILKGPPRILSPSEQYPVDADVYEIECMAISVPKAKHVSWAFNGVLIDLDKDVDFSLRQTVTHNTIKSTLRIEENHAKYFGVYSCTVINKYGSDTLDITYMQRSKLNTLLHPPPLPLELRQQSRTKSDTCDPTPPTKLDNKLRYTRVYFILRTADAFVKFKLAASGASRSCSADEIVAAAFTFVNRLRKRHESIANILIASDLFSDFFFSLSVLFSLLSQRKYH